MDHQRFSIPASNLTHTHGEAHAFMLIDKIFPQNVAEKRALRDSLIAEAKYRGLTDAEIDAILSIVPQRLIDAGSFLDRMTGLWRYEFGIPYNVGRKIVWGTHMWIPVENLFSALFCTYHRLSNEKRANYLKRLANPNTHQTTLVEMAPAHKVSPDVPLEFEIAGFGAGNRTVDWVITPDDGRTVMLDVKRRTVDFIRQAELMGGEGAVPEPDHDPALLFRSVEDKFVLADPDIQLQGVWIFTDIKQNEEFLQNTFAALDTGKVHFAIFGDWKPDAYVLVQRDEDRQYLLGLFHVEPSIRFTFNGADEG